MFSIQDLALNYLFEISSFIGLFLVICYVKKMLKHKKYYSDYIYAFFVFVLIALTFLAYGLSRKYYPLVITNLFTQITCVFALIKSYFYKKYPPVDKYTGLLGITAEDILDNLPGHIFWKNKDGVCLGCNKNQYIDIGGTNKFAYVGKTDYDFLSKTQANHVVQIDREVIRTGEEKME